VFQWCGSADRRSDTNEAGCTVLARRLGRINRKIRGPRLIGATDGEVAGGVAENLSQYVVSHTHTRVASLMLPV
jgi:hypothetical protein